MTSTETADPQRRYPHDFSEMLETQGMVPIDYAIARRKDR